MLLLNGTEVNCGFAVKPRVIACVYIPRRFADPWRVIESLREWLSPRVSGSNRRGVCLLPCGNVLLFALRYGESGLLRSGGERLVKVREQVVRVLDANAEANEIVGHLQE